MWPRSLTNGRARRIGRRKTPRINCVIASEETCVAKMSVYLDHIAKRGAIASSMAEMLSIVCSVCRSILSPTRSPFTESIGPVPLLIFSLPVHTAV